MPGKFLKKNSARFLSSFNHIEKFLTEKLHGQIQTTRFSDKIIAWYEMGYLSKRQMHDLMQIGKLRNALVHEYYDEEVIAEYEKIFNSLGFAEFILEQLLEMGYDLEINNE